MAIVNLTLKSAKPMAIGLGAAAGSFGVSQFALSKVNKPIADMGAALAGIALMTNPKFNIKMIGAGMSLVGIIRTANRFSTPKNGAAPNPVQSFISKFLPNLAGLGELGELGYALPESPTVSYDSNGNMMGLVGFAGDEDQRGVYGDDDPQGISGDEDMTVSGTEDLLMGTYEDTASNLM